MEQAKVGMTTKLRSKYFQKGYPVTLTYSTLRTKITWDGNGIADVPSHIARKLLDKNEFGDGYEQYTEEEKKQPALNKEQKRASKGMEAEPAAKEQEFIDTIKG